MNWGEEDQRLGNVISVPPEVYARGCVRDVDDGLAVSVVIQIIIKKIPTRLVFFSSCIQVCFVKLYSMCFFFLEGS